MLHSNYLVWLQIKFKPNVTIKKEIIIKKSNINSRTPFPFLLSCESKLKRFAQSNPDCSDEQPFLIKTIYRGNQSEKKRAKGFNTLSSKASADQRVLVVLFNSYVTFLPMKYWAWAASSQSKAGQHH